MQYAALIAAAFIIATIAIATLSPFDDLPQRAPREAISQPADDVAAEDSTADADSDEGGSSFVNPDIYPPGEAPPL